MEGEDIFLEKKDKSKDSKKVKGFLAMDLDPRIQKGVKNRGFIKPTPIQKAVIPTILKGTCDVVAMARTGSGKTLAFLAPSLSLLLAEKRKSARNKVVILSPTRELAQQLHREANSLLKFAPDVRNVLCVGGDSLEQQFNDLQLSSTDNRGPDIIVATPGRLLHLLIETTLATMFKRVNRLVVILDEADRLFEMGFKQEIEFIFQKLGTGTAQHGDGKTASHSGRQVLLFSATLPSMLLDFTKVGLNNPSFIRLDADAGLSPNLHVSFFTVRNEEKDAALLYLLREYIDTLWNKAFPDKQMQTQRGEHSSKKIIIFCASRHHVEYIMALLEAAGIHALGVYGKMDQAARRIGLAKFAKGIVPILVVTDVAARGLDLPDIEVVVNYDFPPRPKLFIHRVGRTARLDSRTGQYSTGMALTLVGPDDWPHLLDTALALTLQLRNRELPEDKKDANNRIAFYGNIPQLLIDMELERIHVLVDQSIDLQVLQRSMRNAYKLYHQTRPFASPASAHRAKEMDRTKLHPLMLNLVNTLEIERTSFLQNLKKFRPNQTVFEMEISKKHKNTHLEAMSNIRRKNDDIIQQVKLQRQLKDQGYSATVQQWSQQREATDHYDVSQVPPQECEESSASSDSLFQRTDRKRKREVSSDEESLSEAPVTKRAKSEVSDKSKSSKDDKYFMATQPSLSNIDQERGFAINETRGHVTGERAIEDIVLDLIPDDDQAIFQRRQIEKWDRKRKRFVKENQGADLLTRYVRNEAGQKVKAQLNMNKKRETLTGRKFKDWLSRAGQEDDARVSLNHDLDDSGLDFGSGSNNNNNSYNNNNSAQGYNTKNNYNNRDKRRMPKVETNRRVKNELKNTDQIRKERERAQRKKQSKEGNSNSGNKKGVPFHKSIGKSRYTRSKVLLS